MDYMNLYEKKRKVLDNNLRKLIENVAQEEGISAVLDRRVISRRNTTILLEDGSEMLRRRQVALESVRAKIGVRIELANRLAKEVK